MNVFHLCSSFVFNTSSIIRLVNFKVAILGAAGGVGQPLGMLLKQNRRITDLALYDIAKSTPGVAMDLSHINTCSAANGRVDKKELYETLICASVIVITAAMPSSCQDLFKANADMVFELMRAIVTYAPCALIVVITNPINVFVPLVSEFMKKACVYDLRRVFGLTTLDLVRASTFVGKMNLVSPKDQYVPVVGGNDGATIIPLISQSDPQFNFDCHVIDEMTKKIQDAGPTVIEKKAGKGSATLSTAFAAERFIDSLLRGLKGEPVMESAYVRSDVTEAAYFATGLVLGKCGIEYNLGIGPCSYYEQELIQNAVPILQKDINTAVDYIEKRKSGIPIQVPY